MSVTSRSEDFDQDRNLRGTFDIKVQGWSKDSQSASLNRTAKFNSRVGEGVVLVFGVHWKKESDQFWIDLTIADPSPPFAIKVRFFCK